MTVHPAMKTDRAVLLGARWSLAFSCVLVFDLVLSRTVWRDSPYFSGLALAVPSSFFVVWLGAQKRGLLAASLQALAVAPVLALGASFLIDLPLEDSPFREFIFDHGLPNLAIASAFTLAVGSVCLAFLGNRLARVGYTRRIVSAFRAVAFVAMAVCGIGIVLAATKTYGRMEPDEFRAQLAPMRPCLAGLGDTRCEVPAPPSDAELGRPIDTSLKCGCPKACDFGRPALRVLFGDRDVDAGPYRFSAGDLRRAMSRKRIDFARHLAPPRAWTVVAAFGWIAAFGIALTARADRKLVALLGWTEVDFGGEMMLRDPSRNDGSYRGNLDPRDQASVIPGTHAEVASEIARRRAGRSALVFAVVTLSATPLAVAAAEGFLLF